MIKKPYVNQYLSLQPCHHLQPNPVMLFQPHQHCKEMEKIDVLFIDFCLKY